MGIGVMCQVFKMTNTTKNGCLETNKHPFSGVEGFLMLHSAWKTRTDLENNRNAKLTDHKTITRSGS